MNAAKFLGSLPPGQMDTLMQGINNGLEKMANTSPEEKQQSFWKMRKKLSSPETKAAIAMMANFMEGMGAVLKKNQ